MREMKDSGIEWIGEIPIDWETTPFRAYVVEHKERNINNKTNELLALSFALGVTLYKDKVFNKDRVKENFEEYNIVHKGDLVLSPNDIIKGSIFVSQYYGCISPMYYIFAPRYVETHDLHYLSYLLRTKEAGFRFFHIARGLIGSILDNGKYVTRRMTVSRQDLLSFKVLLPPYKEQLKIVAFLDTKCHEIDALTSDIQTQIETLEQYKKSVITEAVTKGLNPDVEMKDSGIEWIGSIPKDWDTNKVKYLFTNGKGLSITKSDLIDDGLPVVSYGQIHSNINTGTDINDELIRYVDNSYECMYPQCKVNRYDFIFADTSEDYDGCGNCVYKRDGSTLYAGYHSIILHSKEHKDNRYLAYLFKTDEWRKQLREVASGVKVFSISQKSLINSTVIVPPFVEQQKIADYLDDKCSNIDATIKDKLQQLEILADYKKSLIYEYVTGKKEVL
ncbi:MAG: restriction endonuclease subunit S [Lachnospiraceae bacterium]|jgi:type I restriction enzyme S subunit|nr:restriction endonuclease subunit S [Lachnospiraceae bacterium]